jgi:hypothetical protein
MAASHPPAVTASSSMPAPDNGRPRRSPDSVPPATPRPTERPRGRELWIRLAGTYEAATIDRLVWDLRPLLDRPRETLPDRIALDLRRLDLITATGVALIGATLDRLGVRGLPQPDTDNPKNSVLASLPHDSPFVIRMLFPQSNREEPLAHPAAPTLVPVTRFSSDSASAEWQAHLRDLQLLVLDAIDGARGSDPSQRPALDLLLGELTENVGFHAGTAGGGFISVQAFPTSDMLEIGIADLGVGVAGSMRRNPQLASAAADDLTAIRSALSATTTSTPTRNSGYGLTFAQMLLQTNDGSLLVRSGHGSVRRGPKRIEDLVDAHLPGTLIGLRIRTDRPLDYKQAYALLNEAIGAGEPP